MKEVEEEVVKEWRRWEEMEGVRGLEEKEGELLRKVLPKTSFACLS